MSVPDKLELAIQGKLLLPALRKTDEDKLFWVADSLKEIYLLFHYIQKIQKDSRRKKLILLGPIELLKQPLTPAKIIVNAPDGVIGALPLLEDWGVAHRCFSMNETAGAFSGTSKAFVKSLNINEKEIFYLSILNVTL